jgi:Flp pilus assembly protein TadD
MRKLSVMAVIAVLAAHPALAGKNTAEADLAYNLGRNALQAGRAEEAIEQFKKSIALDEENYFAFKGLGIALAKLNNFKEAEKAQRRCIEINPDFADAHNDLATTLMLQGRAAEARKEWQTAIDSPFNPTPEQTASNVAQSYLAEQNFKEAEGWYRKAVLQNKDYTPAQNGLAETLLAQNRVDDAIGVLVTALGKTSTDLDLMVTLGNAYYRAGKFTEARAKLEAVQKQDPVGALGRRATEMLKQFPK